MPAHPEDPLMDGDWVTYLRVFTLVTNTVFMILLPFAVYTAGMPRRTAWLVTAIEVAWVGDQISITRRLINDDPWDWFVSPIFFVASFCAIVWIMLVGRRPIK